MMRLVLDQGKNSFMKFGGARTDKTAGRCQINIIAVKVSDNRTGAAHHLYNPHDVMRCQTIFNYGIDIASGQQSEIMAVTTVIGDLGLRADFVESNQTLP